MLKDVKDGVQKKEVLAVAHNLNQSFQTLHSNAVANTTEMSNNLEGISKTLEEFPSFVRPVVQAAVNSAMETHIQNMESLSSCQQEPDDSCNTMNVEESGKLRGKRKSVECSIQTHRHSRMTKYYHFWFGKIGVKLGSAISLTRTLTVNGVLASANLYDMLKYLYYLHPGY